MSLYQRKRTFAEAQNMHDNMGPPEDDDQEYLKDHDNFNEPDVDARDEALEFGGMEQRP